MGPHDEERPATEADMPALVEMLVAHDIAVLGEAETDADDIRSVWALDGVDPATDTLLVLRDGRIVGYAVVWPSGEPGEFEADLRMDPALADERLVARLLEFAESRGRASDGGGAVTLGVYAGEGDARVLAVLGSRGYGARRFFPVMTKALDEPEEPARWPDGITVRQYVPGADDRAVYDLYVESFSDHWHYKAPGFETWAARTIGRESFDPRLWFVAESGAEPAAALLAYAYDDLAWIGTVGVRRPWRGRGIGLALLRHAFARLRDLGFVRADLEVDADNATGATRLYERAGMTEKRRFLYMAKTLD